MIGWILQITSNYQTSHVPKIFCCYLHSILVIPNRMMQLGQTFKGVLEPFCWWNSPRKMGIPLDLTAMFGWNHQRCSFVGELWISGSFCNQSNVNLSQLQFLFVLLIFSPGISESRQATYLRCSMIQWLRLDRYFGMGLPWIQRDNAAC